MTDKQMDDLAVRVATKVIKAIFNISSEVHLVFDGKENPDDLMINDTEDLARQSIELELIRLQSLLDRYIQEEAYEKANIIKRKIQKLNDEYDGFN
jgi:hypothetical protein